MAGRLTIGSLLIWPMISSVMYLARWTAHWMAWAAASAEPRIVSWKLRFFVPVDASGVAALGKLLECYAIERLSGRQAV